jgi:hypothetical protein
MALSRAAKVTLQISLAPTDLLTASQIVPQQLRVWAQHVDEILLVLNLRRGSGRYGEAWTQRLPGIRRLIGEICARYDHARTVDVDYSEATIERLSRDYLGGVRVPPLDCNGGPFHAYLFAVDQAQNDLVFHCDSDMIYGGGAGAWLDQARRLLAERGDVATVTPLPGPPTSDGRLRSQVLEPEPGLDHAFRAKAMSTRHFLIDRRTLRSRLAPIALGRPNAQQRLTAWLDGMPQVKPLEEQISDRMREEGMIRIEFLGDSPGLWAVHPVYRCEAFYQSLPRVLSDVERGAIPDGQRGHHDLNESMTDWTGARISRVHRTIGHLRNAGRRLVGSLRPGAEGPA